MATPKPTPAKATAPAKATKGSGDWMGLLPGQPRVAKTITPTPTTTRVKATAPAKATKGSGDWMGLLPGQPRVAKTITPTPTTTRVKATAPPQARRFLPIPKVKAATGKLRAPAETGKATPNARAIERANPKASFKRPYGPDESPNLGGRNLTSKRWPTGTAKGGKAYGNARADVTKPTKVTTRQTLVKKRP